MGGVWARRSGVGRRTVAGAAVVVVLVALAAAYAALALSTSVPQCVTQPAPSFDSSTINIGYLTELSGGGVSNGYAARIGAELAVNQTDALGGVDGKTIKLTVLDDQTDPNTALKGACTLAENDGVLAITGPTDQASALAVEGFTEANSVPLVISTVSSAALDRPGLSWTVTVEPDSVQWGAALAKYVSEAIPQARIALMTENAEQQREMAAGVKWYANTFKNESIVFDQLYANAQFPWATAAAAAKVSGADAVVVSWLSTAGFSESNVIVALESAGFQPDQIFVVDATNQVSDLGVGATGIRGTTLFDQGMATGYPNATAFVSLLRPYVDAVLDTPEYCGVCPTDVGPIYYYSYVGMEMMIGAIKQATAGGQPLTRADFMAAMKQQSIEDVFGNQLSFTPSGASLGDYYIVAVGQGNETSSVYPFQIIKTVEFPPGTVPAYELSKTA